ncbi:MAG TPA: DNA polymerase/3'-5' exonuclease PolX [Tepidisphaeraceae bacterium]|nr:DNA polymerase/3'-5' exonuclease PolX [Tepidisphaeraceae bacterium]
MSLNTELAALFATMADIMDIKGENTFKVLAFRKVGRILADLSFDVRECIKNNTLCEIEGIGPSSQRIIEEYVATGRSSDFETLSQSVPATLLPLLQVEGLGPKTISLLWKERKITNADQLKAALEDGSLKGIKTIGDKKLAAIKQGLENRAKSAGRIGIGHALPVAEMFVDLIRKLPGVAHAQYAGSLRRGRETIGDVDIICSVKDPSLCQKIADAFVAFPAVARVIGAGPSKSSIVTASGLQVDLRILPEENFGAALLYFTGSKDHNVKIRGLALKKKMTLNEWGLYNLAEYEKTEKKIAEAPPLKPIASRTEEEIYAKLGLDFIPPELREDRGEMDAALNHKLPKLITQKDLRGDLHSHTTASDGKNSILEMAEAAKALGYEYLAITDHSKSSVIANGLTPDRLLKHIAEIRKAQEKIKGITLLAGSEVDILVDGRLDYEEAILKELDIVIASPHASLKQDTAKATDRIKRAIETRYVNIIGHPTGRLIGGREGLPLEFPSLFKLAASTSTAMEINAGYPRLDLDEFNSRSACEAGVMISIDTDAHSTAELCEIQFGLTVARRAALTAKHILNCQPLKDLRTFLGRKR